MNFERKPTSKAENHTRQLSIIESSIEAAERVVRGEATYAEVVTGNLGSLADSFVPENPAEEQTLEKLRGLLAQLPEAQLASFRRRRQDALDAGDVAGAEFWKSEIGRYYPEGSTS